MRNGDESGIYGVLFSISESHVVVVAQPGERILAKILARAWHPGIWNPEEGIAEQEFHVDLSASVREFHRELSTFDRQCLANEVF